MSNNSLTRLELSDAVVREVGLSRHESMQLVDDVLDHLSNALADGGNVKISSSAGDYLETNQLYWDAESDWFFTNKNFKFWNSDYNVAAKRLDANKQFTKFNTGRLTGTMSVEER